MDVVTGHRTLKLTLSQEGVNLIFGALIQIQESYFNNFWWSWSKVSVAFLGHGTLEATVSHKWISENSWVFACSYKFRKAAKRYFNNYCVGIVKNERGLLHQGTINQVYLTNYLMNWADWLNDFCILIVMENFLTWLPTYYLLDI